MVSSVVATTAPFIAITSLVIPPSVELEFIQTTWDKEPVFIDEDIAGVKVPSLLLKFIFWFESIKISKGYDGSANCSPGCNEWDAFKGGGMPVALFLGFTNFLVVLLDIT